MKLRLPILLILLSLLSGCSLWNTAYFKKSYVSIAGAPQAGTECSEVTTISKGGTKTTSCEPETIGTLFIWEADTSAAILTKDGGICMQTALAVKTQNAGVQAELSNSILKLTDIAVASNQKPDNQSGNSSNQDDKKSKEDMNKVLASIKETAALLTTTTERTAFLNMGMFYICQIALNKSLDNQDTLSVMNNLITSAALIETNKALIEPANNSLKPKEPKKPEEPKKPDNKV